MKSLITLLATLSLTLLAAAQPPDTLWTRTFGGGEDEFGNSVQQTSDGGYIIVGSTQSYAVGGDDAYLIKTDAIGNQVWQGTYGGSQQDWGSAVEQTLDGGYIITGYTESYGAGNGDVFLIKTDISGNLIWQSTFGGSNNDRGYYVQQIDDEGYIITGFSESYGPGGYVVYLIRTDIVGNLIWQRTYGESGSDKGYCVQQTSDGGYIIVGETYSSGTGADIYLLKTDSLGNQSWQCSFGRSGTDCGYSVQQTMDGGYILAGRMDSYNTGYWDVCLIKTDATGDSTWTRTYGGVSEDEGYCVQQTNDGGFIITGSSESFGTGESDVYLFKTDETGNLIWQRTIGGNSINEGRCVQQTSENGYIIAGFTGAFPNFNVFLIKTDAGGTPVQPWGEPTPSPAQFALLGAFPNPFNPSTTIRFTLPQAAQVALEVFDVNGRVVGARHAVPLPAGEQNIVFDGSGLPSGVYIYRLTASGSGATPTIVSGKMVLLK